MNFSLKNYFFFVVEKSPKYNSNSKSNKKYEYKKPKNLMTLETKG